MVISIWALPNNAPVVGIVSFGIITLVLSMFNPPLEIARLDDTRRIPKVYSTTVVGSCPV